MSKKWEPKINKKSVQRFINFLQLMTLAFDVKKSA
jgi:hypothetical protein